MKTIRELASLDGRVALVTGGAGHIGRAIAGALAEAGADVALVDKTGVCLDEACAEVTLAGSGRVISLGVDLADENGVRSVVPAVQSSLGRIDILVNCAAFVGTAQLAGWVTGFEQQSVDTWRQALEVNLTSTFILVQAAVPSLRASGRGSVINIGSIYGMLGPDMRLYDGTTMGNPAAYAASKGGLLQMTRWWATVLAPTVRVNCISPGGIWRNQPEAFVERYVERTPMHRMGTEEDIKGSALFLASDLSAYVTGQNLAVDGGWSAW